MGFLKKLARGAKKIVRKNKAGVGRLVKKVGPGLALAAVGAAAPALVVKAASTAKTLGKKVRGLETPKSLVPVVRAAEVKVRKTRSKLPGGAPMPSMPTIGTPQVGMMKSGAVGARRSLYTSSRKSKTPKRARKVKAPNGAKPRKPPSPAQLAAREKFKKMVAERRKKAA